MLIHTIPIVHLVELLIYLWLLQCPNDSVLVTSILNIVRENLYWYLSTIYYKWSIQYYWQKISSIDTGDNSPHTLVRSECLWVSGTVFLYRLELVQSCHGQVRWRQRTCGSNKSYNIGVLFTRNLILQMKDHSENTLYIRPYTHMCHTLLNYFYIKSPFLIKLSCRYIDINIEMNLTIINNLRKIYGLRNDSRV